MPNDPDALTGLGGELDPSLPPFTADHTPQPSATTSITDALPLGGVTRSAADDETRAPMAARGPGSVAPPAPRSARTDWDRTFEPVPADDLDRTIAPPNSAYVPGAPLQPGTKLGTRYTVLKTLGRGGMGAVYQAYDDSLGVAVAIKTILQDEGTDEHTLRDQVNRFKSELLLARQVTHKNVVRIHDLGEVSGLKYITMSYVAGETLAARIARLGPLPVPETLSLARQIAEGMAAAHEVGVVHRDMKPENVMVTADGQALIMDFGIASSAQHGATDSGQIVGTIAYMSPEQATGRAVDVRADIYAYGLIVYDMLCGRTRQKDFATPIEELRSRFEVPPPAIRPQRAEVPAALEAVVMRCVQPAVADRFSDTPALIGALNALTDEGTLKPVEVPKKRWPAVAGSVAATALAASLAWWYFTPPVVVEKAPVSVLIADFENRTGEPVFDGVVEQALQPGIESASFVTAFPRRDALRVAAGITAGATLDERMARLVALREGVARVLVGAVDKANGRYRISAKLIDGSSEQAPEVASLSVDAADRNAVLTAVGELAGDVREALGDDHVEHSAGASESFTAASLEAAAAYAKAQELQSAGREEDAIAQYQETLRLDPEMGRAYSGLAARYANLGRTTEADANYQEALARIDRMTDREKFRTRGSYYLFSRKPDLAAQEFRALVKAYPADSTGLSNLALVSFYQRDMTEALDQGRRALAIFPNNVLRRSNIALYAMYAGKFDEAIAASSAVHALNPSHVKAFVARALSQLALGKVDEARASYDALAATGPAGASFAAAGLADLAISQGRFGDAATILEAGIDADTAAGNSTAAGRKRVGLAEVRLAQGNAAAAAKEAETALAAVDADTIKAAAGRVLAAAGRASQAELVAGALATRLEADPQAYGRLILAELALQKNQPRQAVDYARDAQKLADTWPGRVLLGRAYLGLSAFPEAYTELESALKRTGEATALYLDDVPTLGVVPPVHYAMGLAQSGLRSPAATASFQAYVTMRGAGDAHPMLDAARQRVAGSGSGPAPAAAPGRPARQ
jgi:tetratricopeptide (TPR) repeat protein